jgi:hypothetical protein
MNGTDRDLEGRFVPRNPSGLGRPRRAMEADYQRRTDPGIGSTRAQMSGSAHLSGSKRIFEVIYFAVLFKVNRRSARPRGTSRSTRRGSGKEKPETNRRAYYQQTVADEQNC